MTTALPIKVTRRAARDIEEAVKCWDANRPAAPGAIRDEVRRAFSLIALQPGVGAQALNATLSGVRRIHMSRVHYFLYYRVRSDPERIDILAFWHTSRGSGPGV